MFEVSLKLPMPGSRDASRTLYEQLKAAILERRLPTGARLPSTRRADAFLGVSRNTAAGVYERLASEGLVVTRPGAGIFVADLAPAKRSAARTGAPGGKTSAAVAAPLPSAMPGVNPVWLRPDLVSAITFWREGAVRERRPRSAEADFRPGLVDSRLFPFETFRKLSARELRVLERRPAAFRSPQGNQGNYRLREAITQHVGTTRAVVCEPQDILVTSGAQQAFDLLARVLVTPGETLVALEDPGYPPMRAAFVAAGARIAPVGVDAEGIIVESIPQQARVICVCPSHHFPLGVSLSAARRRQLVSLARQRGALIIEDDYDGEFRFDGGALDALRTSDAADVVFYVGTFSKCMLPALRLGFIAAPRWAMPVLVRAKNCLDWHSPIPVQASVAAFISEGHLARHIRKMREIYRERREVLVLALEQDLAPWLQPLPSFYGMHLAAIAKPNVEVEGPAAAVLEKGVKILTLSRFFLGQPDRAGMVFGYGAVDSAHIRRALSCVGAAFRARSRP